MKPAVVCMWHTSLWQSKQCQSCKEATSAKAETIPTQQRCLRTWAAWGAGVRSWKHILNSHLCLFLCQMHHCWVLLSPLVCHSELCFSSQSKLIPSLLCKWQPDRFWYLNQNKKSAHYIEACNTGIAWHFIYLEMKSFYLKNRSPMSFWEASKRDSGLWGIVAGTTERV